MLFDSHSLKQWFLSQKRDLPWRETDDPYAIWVSEIMLQQTQVAVVIPYFERWMIAFPTISALAKSEVAQVIKAWEGLGYYSRARNLHEGAKYVLERHNGKLPSTEKELEKIKGIGPYTVGAIMSFAFHKKKAAVDGNVMRVLSRLFNLKDDISKPKTINAIRELAENILPEDEPWIVAEGLIELGATVCMKNPKCMNCPLKASCLSFLKGEEHLLPIKSAKFKTIQLYRDVAVVIAEDKFLVRCGKENEIMSDLYEFPYRERKETEDNKEWNAEFLNIPLIKIRDLKEINHAFTRFRVKLTPRLFKSKKIVPITDYEWFSVQELEQFAFSSGHRRLLQQVKEQRLYQLLAIDDTP